MKAGPESRYRFEYRGDFNLNNASYEDDALNLFRNRLSLDNEIKPWENATPMRLFTEGQEAHSFAESSLDKTNAFTNQLDLRQLFGEIERPFPKIPVSVKVGRISSTPNRYSKFENYSSASPALKPPNYKITVEVRRTFA